MTKLVNQLSALGFTLPPVAKPVAAYVPALLESRGDYKLVRTSGQLPVREGELITTGKVGAEVDLETAQICAQQAGLNALAAAAAQVENADCLAQVLKVTVFVASAPDFTDQALVANGVSELYGKLFAQGHIRSAVGVAVLPLNAPVEVEVEFLVK